MNVASRDQKLTEIEMETFNGQSGALAINPKALDASDANSWLGSPYGARFNYDHFRVWKMLPTGERIQKLGSNPWTELMKGGTFMSR